jgi:hypothetical protein
MFREHYPDLKQEDVGDIGGLNFEFKGSLFKSVVLVRCYLTFFLRHEYRLSVKNKRKRFKFFLD